MAGLNTLRTKGGLFLTIIIGGALLAFILSLALEHGGFSNNDPKVASIDGEDIPYSTYMNQYDASKRMMSVMNNKDYFSSEEEDAIHNVAWQMLLNEYAIRPGFDRLGIGLTEDERLEMIAGAHVSPIIRQTFTNPYTGQFNPEDVVAFLNQANDPQASAAVHERWNYLMHEVRTSRLMEKYVTLVERGLYVTDLEVEQGVNAANRSASGRWTGVLYSEIPDSTVTLTRNEIRSFYDENKAMFRQRDSRTLSYVLFEVLPTDADREKADEEVRTMALEFSAADEPMIYAKARSRGDVDANYYDAAAMPAGVATIAFGRGDRSALYGPVLENDVYTLARVVDVRNLPDSVELRYIALASTESTLLDSLYTVIRAGGDFAETARRYSQDPQTAPRGGELGVIAWNYLPEPFRKAIEPARAGDLLKVDMGGATYIVKLDRKDRMTPKAQIATITYPIVPSSITEKSVRAEAASFNVAAKASSDKFNAAASEQGLVPRVAVVNNGDKGVSGLDNARELVRWAFGAKAGEVSDLINIDGNYIVATLTDSRKAGYATLEQAMRDVRFMLTNRKKFEATSARLAGKSIDEAAQLLGKQVSDFENVRFGSFYIDGLGVDPTVVGAISAVKEGSTSKPVDGMTGVFLVAVDKQQVEELQTPEKERVRLEAMLENYAPQRLNQALYDEAGITDLRSRYF